MREVSPYKNSVEIHPVVAQAYNSRLACVRARLDWEVAGLQATDWHIFGRGIIWLMMIFWPT